MIFDQLGWWLNVIKTFSRYPAFMILATLSSQIAPFSAKQEISIDGVENSDAPQNLLPVRMIDLKLENCGFIVDELSR